MAEIGMDSNRVRAFAGTLGSQADQINAVAVSIDRLVSHLDAVWEGGDAAEFAGWWRGQHKPALVACAQALDGLAASARNNAAAQDVTSGASGSSSASGLTEAQILNALLKARDIAEDGETGLFAVERGFAWWRFAHLTSIPFKDLTPATLEELLKDDHLPKAFGPIDKVAGPLGVFLDGTVVLTDVTGHASGWQTGYDTAMGIGDGIGLVVPEVGLVVGAWQIGVFTGTEITKIPAVHRVMDTFDDGVVGRGAGEVGGDVNTDPAAAQRLVERYSGPMGPIHALSDSLPSWL